MLGRMNVITRVKLSAVSWAHSEHFKTFLTDTIVTWS